jgi:hypothetical protein
MTTVFSVKFEQSRPSVFTELNKRMQAFQRAELAARRSAAQTSQAVSRAKSPSRLPLAPPRRGRAQSSRLKTNIDWKTGVIGGQSVVQLDTEKLDRANRYWIIQEIGTGQRATMKRGGSPNPTGRSTKGSDYVVTVRSQRGRPISGGLVWATGPRGTFMRPRQGTNQNLYLRSQVRGAPPRPVYTRNLMRIGKEIKGSHFIRDGAQAGFRQYRPTVLAAARQAFDRSTKL